MGSGWDATHSIAGCLSLFPHPLHIQPPTPSRSRLQDGGAAAACARGAATLPASPAGLLCCAVCETCCVMRRVPSAAWGLSPAAGLASGGSAHHLLCFRVAHNVFALLASHHVHTSQLPRCALPLASPTPYLTPAHNPTCAARPFLHTPPTLPRWTPPTPTPSWGWASWRPAAATQQQPCRSTSGGWRCTLGACTCYLRWRCCRRRWAVGVGVGVGVGVMCAGQGGGRVGWVGLSGR